MIKQKKTRIIILCGMLVSLCSHSAMACKMTALGGSSQAITAIVNHIAEDPQQQDRTITKIRQKSSTGWTYIVETVQGDNDCRAAGYLATIDPSCQIIVQPINKKFLCKNQR